MFQDYSNEQLIALFDDYLNGHLSVQEMQDVQNELEKNEAFKDEFMHYRLLVDGIREYEKKELKNYLKTLENSFPVNLIRKSNTGSFHNYAVAALLTLSFLLLLSIPFITSSTESGNQLFARYYNTPNELPLSTFRGNTEANRAIQEAYKNQAYANAEQLILNEQDLLSENDEYVLSLAIILINNEKYDEALDLLTQSEFQNVDLRYQKEWYEALVYLRLGNIEAARTLLLRLSRSNSPYAQNSILILRQIE